jgi:hypothetical protein
MGSCYQHHIVREGYREEEEEEEEEEKLSEQKGDIEAPRS